MSDSQSLYYLELSEQFKPTLDKVKKFISENLQESVVAEYYDSPNTEDKWSLSDTQRTILEDRKAKAREIKARIVIPKLSLTLALRNHDKRRSGSSPLLNRIRFQRPNQKLFTTNHRARIIA